ACKPTLSGSNMAASLSEIESGTGTNMDTYATRDSLQALGKSLQNPRIIPGPNAAVPLLFLHKLCNPCLHEGQKCSNPRTSQLIYGSTVTRCPAVTWFTLFSPYVTTQTSSCPN